MNPVQYEQLKDLSKKDPSDTDTVADTAFDEDMEMKEDQRKQEDDYFNCIVQRLTNEHIYSEDDQEFMKLVPEPSELKLFELINKLHRERTRSSFLIKSEKSLADKTGTQLIRENDPLLNET
jgi:hypothetical protein